MRLHLDGEYGDRIAYALDRLAGALTEPIEYVQGEADLIAGTLTGSPLLRRLAASGNLQLAEGPESITIARQGPTVVAAGGDEQGLMYALLEISEQIALEGRKLSEIEAVSERPETALRGLFTFLHNADCEREWFYSAEHWSDYFDLLADSRYNSFTLVLGHQTSYLAPPFPFFIDVPEHPEVSVPELSAGQRDNNLGALRMIADQAARHGLEFVLGIWQVIAWWPQSRGGHTQRGMVDGLHWENLAAYTYRAVKRMLAEVPGIRGLQLRVNGESGVPRAHQTDFFASTFFKAMQETAHPVFLDLRGWIAHPETIAAARALQIPMRLSMKYWAEHLGAPYQAAMQEPAYSYADFLRFPREYPVSYQVWALGSHRHFIWGDPAYVRSFTASLHLGEATGFEISPPLAQKGYGNEPGAWRVLEPEHEYYRWEWERYWMFHLLFGRLSYNSKASSDAWMRRLRAYFGSGAGTVLDAYTAGSQVVSFLIRFNMSDPNMYVWPEADTGGLLDFYMTVPPSDPSRMKGFLDAVGEQLSGAPTARLGPRWAADHLDAVGNRCLATSQQVNAISAGTPDRRRELASISLDTAALGELALYHAEKIRAAEKLALYYATGEHGCLYEARAGLHAARPHWERLASLTDGVYTDRQVTGPVDSGHWKDKLQLVAEDEERIDERIELHRRYGGGLIGGATAAFDFGGIPSAAYTYTRFPVHHDMVERGFTGVDENAVWEAFHSESHGWEVESGVFQSVASPLARFSDRHLDTIFRDTMADPGYDRLVPFVDTLYRDYVSGSGKATFHAVIPAGNYEVIVVCCDRSVAPSGHGPFDVLVGGQSVASSIRVAPGEMFEWRGVHEVGRGILSVSFVTSGDDSDWFCSAIVVRPVAPVLAHVPLHVAEAGSPVKLRLSVTSGDPVEEVVVHISAGGHGLAIPLFANDVGCFEALVPEHLALAGTELAYRFTVRTTGGHAGHLPPLSEATSGNSFRLRLVAPGRTPPIIEHRAVTVAQPGSEVEITAEVESDGPIARAVLHYRYVNQYYEWNRVAMSESDGTFSASIPGSYIVPDWDLMYYIEMVDHTGLGAMAPGGEDLNQVPYWVIKPLR